MRTLWISIVLSLVLSTVAWSAPDKAAPKADPKAAPKEAPKPKPKPKRKPKPKPVVRPTTSTPMDQVIKPGSSTIIWCELKSEKRKIQPISVYALKPKTKVDPPKADPKKKVDPKKKPKKVAAKLPDIMKIKVQPKEGISSYKVYLPANYDPKSQATWPCLFIAADKGKASEGIGGEWLKKNNWIIVMLQEAPAGKWEESLGNFLASHDDAIKRFRIQEGMKFLMAEGQSVRAIMHFATLRPGFLGMHTNMGVAIVPPLARQKIMIYATYYVRDRVLPYTLAEKTIRQYRSAMVVVEKVGAGGITEKDPKQRQEDIFAWFYDNAYKILGRKLPKESVANYILSKIQEFNDTESKVKRFTCGEKIFPMALKAGLKKAVPEVYAKAVEVKTTVMEMKKDQDLRKEFAAYTAWDKARAMDAKVMAYVAEKRLKGREREILLKRVLQGYDQIIEKYPDTEYANKAMADYDRIRAQMGV